MTRQQRRRSERAAAKAVRSESKHIARKTASRALLARQSDREKSGFYGRPVADFISPSRSRVTKRKVKKGQPFARVIVTTKDFLGREAQFHATKGWRSYRISAA